MSGRLRLSLLIVFEILLQGLNVLVGRRWIDESWRAVAGMGVFFLATLIAGEAARRRRERKFSAALRWFASDLGGDGLGRGTGTPSRARRVGVSMA